MVASFDPAQQAEEASWAARSIAPKFDASRRDHWGNNAGGPQADEGYSGRKEQWFRQIVGFPKEKVEWRWDIEYPTAFLANEARSADLVVIKSRREKVDPYHLIDPTGAVLRMGRPMILMRSRCMNWKADRIVVDWKNAREARLAVNHALPFLRKASQVTIIEICKSDEQALARRCVRDVAGYLERRSVKCDTHVRVHTTESDARHLIRLANGERADLVVSGAYGHSRLGEWMFGGMSPGLLEEAPFCLMMSH